MQQNCIKSFNPHYLFGVSIAAYSGIWTQNLSHSNPITWPLHWGWCLHNKTYVLYQMRVTIHWISVCTFHPRRLSFPDVKTTSLLIHRNMWLQLPASPQAGSPCQTQHWPSWNQLHWCQQRFSLTTVYLAEQESVKYKVEKSCNFSFFGMMHICAYIKRVCLLIAEQKDVNYPLTFYRKSVCNNNANLYLIITQNVLRTRRWNCHQDGVYRYIVTDTNLARFTKYKTTFQQY